MFLTSAEKCKWLHEILESLPLIKYPFSLDSLPLSGIYFFYEKNEIWGHGGEKLRIVRIGTHKGKNFRSRISDHFLINNKNFNENKPKPSDRSIFRKNIGRVILNKRKDKYLQIWEIDFTKPENIEEWAKDRDINKEKEIEKEITKIIRENFSFRFIIIEDEKKRIGSEGLERKLIATVAQCEKCKPSKNWLGLYSPKEVIKKSGLWLTQHLHAQSITDKDKIMIEKLVRNTKQWLKSRST